MAVRWSCVEVDCDWAVTAPDVETIVPLVQQHITEAHDRTLTITPRAAGGLCVTVQLPVAPPSYLGLR